MDRDLKLIRSLYPTGRAWALGASYDSSNRAKIHAAINESFSDAKDVADSIFLGAYPNNDQITEEEVLFLEYTYGIYFIEGLTLEQRKEKILQKMKSPIPNLYRQSAAYIEKVLNDAGFDVMVTENTQGVIPPEFYSTSLIQHGLNVQHGLGIQMGFKPIKMIANSVDRNESFSIGSNNEWAAFFISGKSGLSDFIPVNDDRMLEFRELVLKLKPAHTVALIQVSEETINGDFNDDFNDDFLN